MTSQLKQALDKKNFEYLTDIQSLSMPHLLQGNSAVIQAETGSGKSLCYILPILNFLHLKQIQANQGKQVEGPTGAIVLTSSKELVSQTYSFFKSLDPKDQFKIVRLGAINQSTPSFTFKETQNVSKTDEVQHLINWKDIDVLISTPVQLSNIMQLKSKTDPYEINPGIVAIDEYDYQFGYTTLSRELQKIIENLNKTARFTKDKKERQFILCGATAPKKVGAKVLQDEISKGLKNLTTFQTEGFHKLSEHLKIEYIEVPKDASEETELLMLRKLLKLYESKKTIIFCNKTSKAQQVYEFLLQSGEACETLFASMHIEERISGLSKLDSGEVNILIATDLASRGLDFKQIEHVIQFEFAEDTVSLVHRAGRTARCGEKGRMTSFIRKEDEFFMSKVSEVVEDNEKLDEVLHSRRSTTAEKKKETRLQQTEERTRRAINRV